MERHWLRPGSLGAIHHQSWRCFLTGEYCAHSKPEGFGTVVNTFFFSCKSSFFRVIFPVRLENKTKPRSIPVELQCGGKIKFKKKNVMWPVCGLLLPKDLSHSLYNYISTSVGHKCFMFPTFMVWHRKHLCRPSMQHLEEISELLWHAEWSLFWNKCVVSSSSSSCW